MKIPDALQPLVEIFQALDGKGQLWSPSGQFLGLLSSDPQNKYSIINSQGEYGSPFSEKSIQNPQSPYGGSGGIYSPFNPYCANPPVIVNQGKPMLVLTINLNVFMNGLNRTDPYLMLAIYEELANATPKHSSNPLQSRDRKQATKTPASSKVLVPNGSRGALKRPNNKVFSNA